MRRAAAAVVASGVAIVFLLAVVSQTSPSARVLLSQDGGICDVFVCVRVRVCVLVKSTGFQKVYSMKTR